MTPSKWIGHLAVLATNIVFGINIPIAKSVLSTEGVNGNVMSICRFGGAMILFWIASLFTKRERVPMKDMKVIFVASIFGIIMNQWVFVTGLAYASPLDLSIILTVGPILTLILAYFFMKEPISNIKAIGVGMGTVGAVLLALTSNSGADNATASNNLLGIILCFLSSLAYALYLTLFKNIIDRYSPITLMKWMFTFATVIALPFCIGDLIASPLVQGGTTELYVNTFYVVAMATFFTYLLIPVAQKRIRPTVISMYIYVQPVIAGFLSISMGMDKWSWVRLPIIILIFVGVYLVTRSKSREDLSQGT